MSEINPNSKKSIVEKTLQIASVAALSTNMLTMRADAFPVRFSGTQPNSVKTEYYADFDPQRRVLTQTKAANQNINTFPASPGYRYPSGFVDNLVQTHLPPFALININKDFMSTENLQVINNISDIPVDQRYIPSPDGRGYQLLKQDGSNALAGAEVFKGTFDQATNQFRILARTKILISGTDPQRGTIFFQMPR